MTDNEKMQKTYRKVNQKYPDATDKEEITELAIRLEKKNTIFRCLAWMAGAVICFIIFVCLLNTDMEILRTMVVIMTGSALIEAFRTFAQYFKVEQRYRPVLKVKHEGELTKDIIIKDGGRKLRKADGNFRLLKTKLYDKEDETDVGTDNETIHTYYLMFEISKHGKSCKYKVSRKTYMNAVIGAQYYVTVLPDDEIVAIYQATNWTIDSELLSGVIDVISEEQNTYQTNNIEMEHITPVKTRKLLPILSLVLMIVSYVLPVFIGLGTAVAGLVLSIVGVVRQKSKLSITSLVANVILFVILSLTVVFGIVGSI